MTDEKFQKLLDVTARHTARSQELNVKVSNECIRRYGTHYSDIDADGIIDVLDYMGAAGLSLSEFDDHMILSGAVRVDG